MQTPPDLAATTASRPITTSTELVAACLDRTATDDLNIMVDTYGASALQAAARADAAAAAGEDLGALHGIPVAVKDVIATREGPTRAGSRAWDDQWHRADAVAVARLRSAGAVVLGKTLTLEFAAGMPAVGDTNPVGRNPWRPTAWTGGSSSGSAAGLVAGMFLGAVGTDTGGSIRCPAAYCGITGLKPTLGLVPTEGMVPWAPSFDTIGPMARTAKDCAVLLDVLADRADPAGRSGSRVISRPDLTGVRIGVVSENHLDGTRVDPDVARAFAAAIEVLAAAGADVVPAVLPRYRQVVDASMVITPAEGYAHHRRNLRARWSDYGRHTRVQIAAGAVVGAADYYQAQRLGTVARGELQALMTDHDVLAMVTASTAAPEIDDLYGVDLHELIGSSIFTPYWNVLGNPAVSVPVGRSATGLPFGLQLVGRPWQDFALLAVADVFQRRTDWHRGTPVVHTVGSAA